MISFSNYSPRPAGLAWTLAAVAWASALGGCAQSPAATAPGIGLNGRFPLGARAWATSETLDVSSLSSRAIVLDFFALWYPESAEVAESHDALYARYRDRGLAVLGCGREHTRSLKDFARELALDYPLFSDPEGVNFREFQVKALPHSLVYGPGFQLLYEGHPGRPAFGEAVKRSVDLVEDPFSQPPAARE